MSFAPRLARKLCPAASATLSGGTFWPPSLAKRGGPKLPPLSEIARWNNPFAAGEAASMLTAIPPADSPKIVTRAGSPPNFAMFALTHCRPAI